MQAVGIRELKAKLGRYVRRARDGEIVLITDRGRVVAELRAPISVRGLPEAMLGLVALVDKGEATLGLATDASVYQPSGVDLAPGMALTLLAEERGDR